MSAETSWVRGVARGWKDIVNWFVCCRYKKANERQSLDGPMSRLLPRIRHICVQLFADNSELAVFVQKQILKVFFSLIQVLFPIELCLMFI